MKTENPLSPILSSLVLQTEQDYRAMQLAERINTLEQELSLYQTFDDFDTIMRWKDQQTIESWSHYLLMKVAFFAKACKGTFYYLHIEKQELILSASFAITNIDALQTKIPIGEGLIGTVCKTQTTKVIDNYQQQLILSSKLSLQAATIVLLPLVYNVKSCGVMELTFTEAIQPKILDFLEKLAPRIASNLNSIIKEEILQKTLQRFKESEKRLHQMAVVTTEGILFLEGKRIIEVNLAFLKLTGYTEEEVLHKNFDKFFGTNANELLTTEGIDTALLCNEHKKLYVAVNSADIVVKNTKLKVLRLRDITEQKQAEMQVALQTKQLQEANEIVELLKIIEAKNANITTSIKYAQRIQSALLPQRSQMQDHFQDYFMLYQPRDIVSGDFYWLQPIQNQVMLAVGDCTGHGVPAAFMSMLGIATLNHITLQKNIYSPDLVLDELRKEIYYLLKQDENQGKEGMDIALCLIDAKAKKVKFAGAKNDLIQFQNQEIQIFKGTNTYIGGAISQTPFTLHEFDLQTATTIYLFTDGYRDQIGGADEKKRKIGSKHFRAILQEIHTQPMRQQQIYLEKFFKKWKEDGDEEQLDDVAVLGVRIDVY